MEYAKFINEQQIDLNVPSKHKINGTIYVGDLTLYPEIMSELGFLPVDRSETIEPEWREGWHNEERYAIEGDKIVVSIVQVEDPPAPPLNREISKRKLMNALKSIGLWATVKNIMEQNDYLEDWETSTTLEEQDPLMQGAIAIVKQAAGLNDDEVNQLIEDSLAY